MSEAAEKIDKILRTGVTQTALARKIGIKQSAISTLIGRDAKEPKPSRATCLALAGVCPPEDHDFWMALSNLNSETLASIAKALGVPMSEHLSADERELLDWYRNPRNPLELHFRDGIQGLIRARKTEQQ